MSKLELVVSDTIHVSDKDISFQPITPNRKFRIDVKKPGFNIYEMIIQDPFHCLKCSLILELEEKAELARMICHFPSIYGEPLRKLIGEDDTLYGVIMTQFQMKIMEQLLSFCFDHYASQLIIYTDDPQAEELEIYQEFLIYRDQRVTKRGEQTKITIPSNRKTFDAWGVFMRETSIKLGQEVWRNQRSNPIIQRYLKSCT
jgi:hypothetical protein